MGTDGEADEPLTPAGIHQIAWDIRDGEADPADARRLLLEYCRRVDEGSPIPYELTRHLRDAFKAFLKEETSLSRALGVERRPGRPKADRQMRERMAAEVLRHRLDGASHQTALEETSERFGWGVTIVGTAWANHKQEALILLRIERALSELAWSKAENERLADIFEGEPWFTPPGRCARSDLHAFLATIDGHSGKRSE